MYQEIKNNARTAVKELLEVSGLRAGEILVIGCSSSEIVGGVIGKNSSTDAADAVFKGAMEGLEGSGVYLCAQCCEHLNRALIMERECAEKYGYEIVCVVPQPKAGGSFATAAYYGFKDPVAVEYVKAHAGIDIGATFIGMHLRHVAVPVRLSLSRIGSAPLTAARTRPKFIGGERAAYTAL
jgi:uncharacterized protein (TIGR01440 family)